MRIGVLALQGAFREHINVIKNLGVEAVEVRTADDINSVDGLILPGGESTAIGKLLIEFNLTDILMDKIRNGLPVFGTCAGMILLAKEIINDDKLHLPLMDISVLRNAYGRQLGSFYCEAPVKGIADDIKMTFIRAPYIEKTDENVEILAMVEGHIVAAKQDNMFVISFHPEVTDESRVHQFFIKMCKKYKKPQK